MMRLAVFPYARMRCPSVTFTASTSGARTCAGKADISSPQVEAFAESTPDGECGGARHMGGRGRAPAAAMSASMCNESALSAHGCRT
eukprot:scaffold12232_cov129-Isochrysis_galbana.AAC.3